MNVISLDSILIMKNTLYSLAILAFSLFLVACGKETKKHSTETKTNTVQVNKKANNSIDFRERLKTTEPATEAQFHSWIPTSLGAFNRVEFTTSRISQNDIASAGAIYKNGGEKKLELAIVDGASKDGLLAINPHYIAHNSDLNSKIVSGYEKTYEHNGLKVLETYVKDNLFYRVLILHDTRFGITVESNGLSYDELWEAISELDLNELNNF